LHDLFDIVHDDYVAIPASKFVNTLSAAHASGMDSTHAHNHSPVSHTEVPFTEAEWDARYGTVEERMWSGNPNPVLVAEVTGLTPGTALDVGCGEGADALWLADRGWKVTGVDISSVALKRAAAQGESQGLAVEWRRLDLLAEPLELGSFDLVSAQFMHLPGGLRRPLYARLAAAVAPGGTLLLVGHDFSDVQTSMPRPDLPDMFFTAGALAADLDPRSWEVLVAESRPRQTLDPEGREITIRDSVLMARKRQRRSGD
jgi:SAM-dependent methyltransferase